MYIKLISISKLDKQNLEKAGLLKHCNKTKRTIPNFYISGKQHKSRDKNCFMVDTDIVLKFIGRFDSFKLPKITKEQFDSLVEAKLITENTIQNYGTYVKGANCYYLSAHDIYIERQRPLMEFLGMIS